jgi:hypothetical protein
VPAHAHVPDDLTTRPFLARDAVLSGRLTPRQLQSSAWRRLLRGVYVHESVEVTSDVRLAAVRLVLPKEAVACGLLAAWLHGVWVPRPGALVSPDVTRPVLSSGTPAAGQNRRRLTLRGSPDWSGALTGYSATDQDVVERDGLLVTSPLRTCFDLMRERRLVEAVVVADAFLYSLALPRVLLAAYVADRRRWPGVREARVAVDLARGGVRSPGETRLRMVVVLAGFPEPWVNVEVLDGAGRVVAVLDLLMPVGSPLGLEYDGGYHDEDEQGGLDRRRTNRLTTSAGVPLLRYDWRAVRQERNLIVEEIRAMTGVRPRGVLVEHDFWRPPAHRAW